MDAESAAAMWEESNMNLRSQCIILRHLALSFRRRLTVPESKIRALELGVLPPITGSVEIRKETIRFWYMRIEEAIKHRLKLEINILAQSFFHAQGYDCIDVVFGGDHGQ